MFQYYLPEPLYEILPYLYGTVGGISVFSIGNGLGVFSGALFLMASLMVWKMRKDHRSGERAAQFTID